MSSSTGEEAFRAHMQRLERLLGDEAAAVDSVSPVDPARARAQALVQAVLDVHRCTLGRLMEHLAEHVGKTGEAGSALMATLVADPLVSHLLALHDLHPTPLAERVHAALVSLAPSLATQSLHAELIGIVDDVARLRLSGAATSTARAELEDALLGAAPELAGVAFEVGVAESPARRYLSVRP